VRRGEQKPCAVNWRTHFRRMGQDAIRRVLFVTGQGATPRSVLGIIQEKNRAQGKSGRATC